MMMPQYKGAARLIKGPCVVCGLVNYNLSMGGPHICPACDCGISTTDPRHPVNRFKTGSIPAPYPEREILRRLERIETKLDLLEKAAARLLTRSNQPDAVPPSP